jgi:hypothetical protein
MNERIKAIGRQAGFAFIEGGVYGNRWYTSKCGMDASEFEKFAELVVLECIKMVENEAEQYAEPTWAVELVNDMHERFGLEP